MFREKNSFIGVSLVLLFFVLDYCTKYEITQLIPYKSSEEIVNGLFNLVNIHNSGIALGMFAHLPQVYRIIFLCGISFIVFVVVVILIIKGKNRNIFFIFGLSLLAGGALGNLAGRITKGYVVDFLDFYFKDYHYPAFNLADSFITIGIVILLLYSFFYKKSA